MRLPPAIPDHTLRRPIGRGAYGEVWLARNIMGAPRAVKIVWRRQFESDRPYEREFQGVQRYEPVSRSADGLVHVLHVGRNDAEGYFYYVMELADPQDPAMNLAAVLSDHPARMAGDGAAAGGTEVTPLFAYEPRTLRSDLKRMGRLPTADGLRAALEVSAGLGQLHRRGLVHRDVKPGNIIFVDGRAKLADLGLVTADGERGTFVGTEGYIPPEGPGTPAADIYGLGVVLYEATTGFPPDRFPEVPSEWLSGAGDDDALELHEIVLRACEGRREHRYESAEAMQADLALLQSGQSVRRKRVLEGRAVLVRRYGWLVAMLVVGALLAALVFSWQARLEANSRARESVLREKAQTAAARAESAEREARRQLHVALREQARALVASREIGHRRRALEAVRQVAGTADAPLAELRRTAFAALGQPDFRLTGELTNLSVTHQMFPDPALSRVALCRGRGPVPVHSLTNGELLFSLAGTPELRAFVAAWSDDGRYLGIKRDVDGEGREAQLEVWEFDGGTPRLAMQREPMSYASFTFHPRERRVLVGRIGGRVTERDLETGRFIREVRLAGTVHALAWAPDGERYAAAYREGETNWLVALHTTNSVVPLVTWPGPEPVETIAWHPSGGLLSVTGPHDTEWQRQVRLLEVATGRTTILGRHKLKAERMKFTGDGRHLLTGGWDRELNGWDLRSRERIFTFPAIGFQHGWNAAGTRCASAPEANRIQIHELEPPWPRELVSGQVDGLLGGVFSPDGRWLAVPGVREVCVWDREGDGPPAVLPKPVAPRLVFSPDSRELFVSGEFKIQRWRLVPSPLPGGAPRLEARSVPPIRQPNRVSVRAGDLVATSAGGVSMVALTNLEAGRWDREIPMDEGWGEVSPDGRWLGVFYNFSAKVRVYRLPEVDEVANLTAPNYVSSLAFAPDGGELVVIHRRGVEAWETVGWRRTTHRVGTPVSGAYAFYPPDGSGLWMVTQFRNTGLFSARTGESVLPLPADCAPLAASADGRWLAVSTDGRRVQVWDLAELRREFRALGIDW